MESLFKAGLCIALQTQHAHSSLVPVALSGHTSRSMSLVHSLFKTMVESHFLPNTLRLSPKALLVLVQTWAGTASPSFSLLLPCSHFHLFHYMSGWPPKNLTFWYSNLVNSLPHCIRVGWCGQGSDDVGLPKLRDIATFALLCLGAPADVGRHRSSLWRGLSEEELERTNNQLQVASY